MGNKSLCLLFQHFNHSWSQKLCLDFLAVSSYISLPPSLILFSVCTTLVSPGFLLKCILMHWFSLSQLKEVGTICAQWSCHKAQGLLDKRATCISQKTHSGTCQLMVAFAKLCIEEKAEMGQSCSHAATTLWFTIHNRHIMVVTGTHKNRWFLTQAKVQVLHLKAYWSNITGSLSAECTKSIWAWWDD